jgi:hypothetical protein
MNPKMMGGVENNRILVNFLTEMCKKEEIFLEYNTKGGGKQ